MDCIKIWKVFGQIGKLHYMKNHKVLENLGVYSGQPPLLMLLRVKDGQSQKELAEHLMIKPATVNVMIKRMEKSGFVRKDQDTEDLRTSRIFLSEKGKKISDELCSLHKKESAECLEGFSEEELETLYDLLCKIRDNISRGTK